VLERLPDVRSLTRADLQVVIAGSRVVDWLQASFIVSPRPSWRSKLTIVVVDWRPG